MLREQYGSRVFGLQDVVKAKNLSMDVEPNEFVQILNKSDSHWFTISTIGRQPGVVNVFDSATKYTTKRNREEIAVLLHTSERSITLHYMSVQVQSGASDCGLFALAFATALCTGINPTACTFDQATMRQHFLRCIQAGEITQFPLRAKRRLLSRPVRADTFEVHCHCRMPHSEVERMVFCNGTCKLWYHESCEQTPPGLWTSKQRWFCRNCKK